MTRRVPTLAIPALGVLTLSLSAGCNLGGSDSEAGDEDTLVGNWNMVRFEEDGEVYVYPYVYQDPDYGCTVTETVMAEVEDDLTGRLVYETAITECNDPSYNDSYSYTLDLTIEDMGMGDYAITDEDGYLTNCTLSGDDLSCTGEDGEKRDFERA
jgi:hypothetical protein